MGAEKRTLYAPYMHPGRARRYQSRKNATKKKGSDKIMSFPSKKKLPLDKMVELLERDESDLDAIRDIQKALEQHREDIRQDLLLQQADEGKPQ